MLFKTLQDLLLPVVGPELTALYLQFREESDSDDSDLFLAWLRARGRVPDDVFLRLLTWDDVALTALDDLHGIRVAPANTRTTEDGRKVVGGRPSLSANTRAEDRYNLLAVLGQGAVGEVVVAKDKNLHRKVAFKRMTPTTAKHDKLVGRFLREVQITAQLDHPNIVPVYGLEVTAAGDLGYAMKLIPGKSLADLVRECRERLDAGRELDGDHALVQRLEYFLKACDAVGYAHSRGVVHRDITPKNIMIGAYQQAYVVDWGVARLFRDPASGMQLNIEPQGDGFDFTQQGQALGTPAYMSPEQAEGLNDALDGRSDEYSLGLVLFELVALQPALTGPTDYAILARACEGELEPLVHYKRTRIPRELRAIIAKATAKDPAGRYRGVRELGEDVRRYLRGRAVLARPDGPIRKVTRAAGRHPLALLIGILLTMMAAGFLVSVVVVDGLVSGQLQRMAAEARERRLVTLQSEINGQRSEVDLRLLRYEALLEGLGGSALQALHGPESRELPVHYSEDYGTDREPADVRRAQHYDARISLETPVFKLAPGLERRDALPTVRRMSRLGPSLRRTALRSESEDALALDDDGQWDLVADRGVPLLWLYVATPQGVHCSWPGHTGYSAEYDPRGRPWYAAATNGSGVVWGTPYADATAGGLVITASMGLYDGETLEGVAGVDVMLEDLARDVFGGSSVFDGYERYLVDAGGQAVVASEGDPLRPFPYADALASMGERETGHVEVSTPDDYVLVLYSRVSSLGWHYVVAGPVDALLSP